ncbi:hypothetical protein Plo01_09470 [Planobispora longispora]|uniref:Uncharacterized protein n=1 Tax=Planobispora longispora TaxID=28887 RepID=A0A8J3RLJ8_9ACTN|nr:hypothetical protein GCM10020093_093330 [Planobispora longispora]GIH74518.1 hypothetical protein Plo01_09470 [Planobispora longispora]
MAPKSEEPGYGAAHGSLRAAGTAGPGLRPSPFPSAGRASQAGLAGAAASPESTSGSGSRPGVMMFSRLIMKLNTA